MYCFIFSLQQTFQMSLAHATQSGKETRNCPLCSWDASDVTVGNTDTQNCLPNARFPLKWLRTLSVLQSFEHLEGTPNSSSLTWAKLLSRVPYWDLRRHPLVWLVINLEEGRRQNWDLRPGRGGGWRFISASDWVWLTQCPHFSRTFITGSPALKLILRFPCFKKVIQFQVREGYQVLFKYVASFNRHKSLSAYVLSFPSFHKQGGQSDQKLNNNLPKGTIPNSYDIYFCLELLPWQMHLRNFNSSFNPQIHYHAFVKTFSLYFPLSSTACHALPFSTIPQ